MVLHLKCTDNSVVSYKDGDVCCNRNTNCPLDHVGSLELYCFYTVESKEEEKPIVVNITVDTNKLIKTFREWL